MKYVDLSCTMKMHIGNIYSDFARFSIFSEAMQKNNEYNMVQMSNEKNFSTRISMNEEVFK